MDVMKQQTYEARYSLITGFNAAAASYAMSAVLGTVVAILVNVHSSSFVQRAANDIIGVLIVIWWRKTYLEWANSKAQANQVAI